MYHKVLHIVCFQTFSVKRKENDLHRKYFLGRGPCEKCIFSFNFTDRTKLMILFHLQRLGADHKVFHFLNFLKMKCRKRFDFFLLNITFSCDFFFTGNRIKQKNRNLCCVGNSISFKMMFVSVLLYAAVFDFSV